MDKADRTMILAILTMLCLTGVGVSEVLKLDATVALTGVGFCAFGIGTFISVFSPPDNPFDEEADIDG